ncbi:MAG: DUF3093 domain-containing protein [Aquiluna sp.]
MRYTERLWPSFGILLATSLSFPMLLLAALPFGTEIGITISVTGTIALFALVILTAPTISVSAELIAGRMRIPLSVIGKTQPLNKLELRELIGAAADARAQLFIRGYVKSALKIEISDSSDPTPYVVISTRKPEQLAVALLANRS